MKRSLGLGDYELHSLRNIPRTGRGQRTPDRSGSVAPSTCFIAHDFIGCACGPRGSRLEQRAVSAGAFGSTIH